MDSAGDPFIVKALPCRLLPLHLRNQASDTRTEDDGGYKVNRDNMTIFNVDPSFGAPEGSKIVAVNGINVSSWDEYLHLTTWTSKGRKNTRLSGWDLHLQLPQRDEQRVGTAAAESREIKVRYPHPPWNRSRAVVKGPRPPPMPPPRALAPQSATASGSAAQPPLAMNSASGPFVVRVRPREKKQHAES